MGFAGSPLTSIVWWAVLVPFLTVVIKYLKQLNAERVCLASVGGYSPLWWRRHEGRGQRHPFPLPLWSGSRGRS